MLEPTESDVQHLRVSFRAPLWSWSDIMGVVQRDCLRLGLRRAKASERWRGLSVDVDITFAGARDRLELFASMIASRLEHDGHRRVSITLGPR